MLLVNLYPDIMLHAEDAANGTGGLLHYFYLLDEWYFTITYFLRCWCHDRLWSIDRKPEKFPAWCSSSVRYLCSLSYELSLLDSQIKQQQLSPLSVELTALLQSSLQVSSQTAIMGPIAVAAYSYMSLVPIIQPPIMKLFTTEKERKIKMDQFSPVSKLEKYSFPCYRYNRCMCDSSYNSSTCWYVDVW